MLTRLKRRDEQPLMKQGQSPIEISSALRDAVLNYECPRIKKLLPAIGGLNGIAQALPDLLRFSAG